MNQFWKKSVLVLICALFIAIGFPATIQAAPVVFCKNGPAIDLAAGCISGGMGYPGGGDGLFSNVGGGDTESKVEQSISMATGVLVDIVLYGKSDDNPGLFTFTPASGGSLTDSHSGMWTAHEAIPIQYITVTAAQGYSLYYVGGVSSGTYTTAGLLTPNGRNEPKVSHISF